MRTDASQQSLLGAGGRPGTVVASQTARRAVRSGALWGAVFGAYVAANALTYATSYGTPAERNRLATLFGTNAGVSALVGPAHAINTEAGFTAWKCLATLAIVGAVWGLLTGTRLLRGEEDAGRWELLLAGQTTRRGATAQAIGGLGAGFAAFWVVAALLTVAVGRSAKVDIGAGATLFFSLAFVSGAAMFLAVGALTSQLAATRRQAAAYAAAFLGASYALRMVADSGTGLTWLRWVSPLGWVEELQPLTAPRPLALVPIVGFTAVLIAAAVRLAGTRDLGASTIPDREKVRPHTRMLSGPAGLTIRLIRPTVVGWEVGIVAGSLLLGLIANSAGSALQTSSSLTKVLSRLGASGANAAAYLGIAFLIAAVLVSLIAAGQLSAIRSEEAEGRLDHLLVRPVSRTAWLAGRLGIVVLVLAASGLLAGVFAWLGTASQHAGLRATDVIDAGLNIVPPSLCLLGVGALAFGIRPRASSSVTYAVLAWSFLVELVGGIVGLNHWVLDISIFHQMAAAPAMPPDWTSAGALVAAGTLGAIGGAVAFRRRDLAGE